MDALILEINQNTYNIRFSYKCFKLLGQHWKIDDYAEVIMKVAQIGDNLEKLSFEAVDNIGEIVKCGIIAGDCPEDANDFDTDDFIDFLLQDLEKLQEIFAYLGDCMPKNKSESEKPKATKSLKGKK